jgi:hypothetical protein
MRVSKPKETISSMFLKYSEYKPSINCQTVT